MLHYYDDGSQEWGPELLILINMETTEVSFELPEDRNWGRAIDTQAWWDDGYLAEDPELNAESSHNIDRELSVTVQGPYALPAKSVVVLEAVE